MLDQSNFLEVSKIDVSHELTRAKSRQTLGFSGSKKNLQPTKKDIIQQRSIQISQTPVKDRATDYSTSNSILTTNDKSTRPI